MSTPRRRWLLGCLLGVVGCVESAQPLTAAKGAKPDQALVGTWVEPGEDMRFTVSVVQGSTMRVVLEKRRGDAEKQVFEGHVSVLGKVKVLNLRVVEEGQVGSTYVFVRYAVGSDGRLSTWLVDPDPVHAAMTAGTLKGERTQYGGTTLDESSEKLARFFSEKPDERFKVFAIFERQKP